MSGRRRSSESALEQLRMARHEGESTGRMLGRLAERRRIIAWLTHQRGTPVELAQRINNGEHRDEHIDEDDS